MNTPTRRFSSANLTIQNDNNSPLSNIYVKLGNNVETNLNRQKSLSISSVGSTSSENSNSDSPYLFIRRLSKDVGPVNIYRSPDEKANEEISTNNIKLTGMNRRGSLCALNNLLSPNCNNKILNDASNQFYKRKLSLVPVFNLEETPHEELAEENEKNNIFDHQNVLIKQSLEIDEKSRNLIGDRSRELILPTVTNSKHQDLNCISPETLVDVLNGAYKEQINEFIIIDSRYPYEYEGGHIKTALNIFTQEKLGDEFFVKRLHFTSNPARKLLASRSSSCFSPPNLRSNLNKHNSSASHLNSNFQRKIIIFHCEFSSERGPSMLKFLRRLDRHLNENAYPTLYYPELYLLEGGYKCFYEKFKSFCQPSDYVRMLDRNHVENLKYYRNVVKVGVKNVDRASRSRLGPLKF